jgi:hypothetical protein
MSYYLAYDRGFSCDERRRKKKRKKSAILTLRTAILFFPLHSKTHLLVLEEREQAHPRDLDDLKADTGNITHGVPRATETSNQHLIL